MMGFKELMETNPVLLVQGAAAFAGVCTALGLRELLNKAIERYWHKEDEKNDDHKKIEELSEKVDMILDKLEKMEENDKKGFHTDLLLLESTIAEMQNRAIVKGKVSRTCIPRYLKDYKRYINLADETEDYEASEEINMNHQRILALINNGNVAESLEEWYK